MRITDFRSKVWSTIRDIQNNLQKIADPVLKEYGLTPLQIRVLSYISTQENCTIGDVGEYFDIAGGNISNLCKRLEMDGYLVRNRSEKDRRVVYVSLSEEGTHTMENIVETLDGLYGEKMNRLDEEELEDMIAHMQRMNQIIKDLLD